MLNRLSLYSVKNSTKPYLCLKNKVACVSLSSSSSAPSVNHHNGDEVCFVYLFFHF